MKKLGIKVITLVLIFIGALTFFSITTNRVNEDLTTVMASATLPVIHFIAGDMQVNELHGYVEEMDAIGMREDIMPVSRDRLLRMSIDTYGGKVDGIHYEIRSMNAQRLMAEADVVDYEEKDNRISATIKLQNILEQGQEFLMVFTLDANGRTVRYYTRIIQVEDEGTGECLKFAKKFHEYTFKKEGSKFFPTYMDEATGDATTLNYVDLTCTVKQIMWANFKGEILVEPVASFKEINSSYNVITLNYVMGTTDENGEVGLYNVEEYYRLRLTETRMYVLNFERQMNQIFTGEDNFLEDLSKIKLGIRNKEVEYKTNEAGNIICFVQEGELWCYNQNNREITRVFSFRDMEGYDCRNNWLQHDIKIVRIDEAGSIDFIVYGYMNRGTREGNVGTLIYHYDGLAHTVEEEVFIPYTKSYEVLRAEMGQLMYENDQGILYLMQEGNVYSIDLNVMKIEKEIVGLKAGCYATSVQNDYIAWVESEKKYDSTELYLLNLKNGKKTKITETAGKYLQPLGFMGQDLIYGIAEAENVTKEAAGNTVFPMKTLKIVNTSEDKLDVLKEYSAGKKYIEGIKIEESTIFVQLIKLTRGQYVLSGTDSIMNRDMDKESNVGVGVSMSDTKETEIHILLKKAADSAKVKMITSKEIIQTEENELAIVPDTQQERFYVYVKGTVSHTTDSISDAISQANERMGVVVDSEQQYVWMRARKIYSSPFEDISPSNSDMGAASITKCVSAMLRYKDLGIGVSDLMDKGMTPKEILENNMKDYVILDLTGCVTEDILFYVSKGSPVLSMIGNESAVLVIGYTGTNINYYEPVTGKKMSVTFKEADKMFHEGGNKFLTFLEQ